MTKEVEIIQDTLDFAHMYSELKKWLLQWKPVIDYSMKRLKELAQERSIPIWRHFTANKPAKTTVSRKVPTRQYDLPKKMSNNPLTNVFSRLKKKQSLSQVVMIVVPPPKVKRKPNHLLTQLYTNLGK